MLNESLKTVGMLEYLSVSELFSSTMVKVVFIYEEL